MAIDFVDYVDLPIPNGDFPEFLANVFPSTGGTGSSSQKMVPRFMNRSVVPDPGFVVFGCVADISAKIVFQIGFDTTKQS